MKLKVLLIVCLSCLGISLPAQYYATSSSLNMDGALKLAQEAVSEARKMDKNVSVAVLDATGTILLLLKGDGVGPHNTEASRRKAYTAVSTKNATWELMQKAAADPTSTNLTTLPELLLLGGGVPVWAEGKLIGSIGVSGGGGGWNDHEIASRAIVNLGFKVGL